jgi:plasmid maintenance system antidote protein VapI
MPSLLFNQELAKLIDVSKQSINEIFKKRQGITIAFVQKFCNYFRQVNVEFLLFGKGQIWNNLSDEYSTQEVT